VLQCIPVIARISRQMAYLKSIEHQFRVEIWSRNLYGLAFLIIVTTNAIIVFIKLKCPVPHRSPLSRVVIDVPLI
jgi:hypothetical protein